MRAHYFAHTVPFAWGGRHLFHILSRPSSNHMLPIPLKVTYSVGFTVAGAT